MKARKWRIFLMDPIFLISAPGEATNRCWPSAGTVLTTESYMLPSRFCLCLRWFFHQSTMIKMVEKVMRFVADLEGLTVIIRILWNKNVLVSEKNFKAVSFYCHRTLKVSEIYSSGVEYSTIYLVLYQTLNVRKNLIAADTVARDNLVMHSLSIKKSASSRNAI